MSFQVLMYSITHEIEIPALGSVFLEAQFGRLTFDPRIQGYESG